MIERAPAKVNLCLFVGGTRPGDGRHELVSVMQAVDLCDELRLVPATGAGAGDEVACPGVEGPNLVGAALAAFRERTGWAGSPVRVEVTKRIPVAAGMAGGSADAAAALRLLVRAGAGRPGRGAPTHAELLELAAGLGADVPAQVRPGRHLAEGAGERVEALPPVWPAPTVLVLPSEAALATPAVFREFDRLGLARSPADLDARRAEVRASVVGRRAGLPAALVVNDLEAAALSLLPALAGSLEQVRATGADHALVSGSGPTVLGLYGDPGAARAAAQVLRRHHPRVVLTAPVHAT